MAPNRLVPHFTGPYKVARVSEDANCVHVLHCLTPTAEPEGTMHVSLSGRRLSLTASHWQ